MDIHVFLSIFGAVTGAIALIWNIFQSVSHYAGKLKVEKERGLKFKGEQGNLTPILICKVTNIGKVTRYIYLPKLEFASSKNVTHNKINKLNLRQVQSNDYPKELKPGEVHIIELDLFQYYDEIFNDLDGNTKFVFLVLDTHGKEYSSEKFPVGDLISDVLGTRAFIRSQLLKL